MSITNSLYIGTSGLTAHGDAISVVGDNIANASTIGYKRQRAGFADVLGGQLGAQRLGGGVRLGGVQTMFEQGALQQSGNPLDLAIRGNGFFAVRGEHGGVDNTYYTRDGRFHLDSSGMVVNSEGLRLQGYAIDGAGQRATQMGDLPLGAQQSPVATTAANIALNLDSRTIPATPVAFDPANPTATSQYQTSVTVHDSLGAEHSVQLYFTANATGGWDWNAMVDGGELAGGTPGTAQVVGGGALTFNPDGTLATQAGSITANFLNAAGGQAIAFDFTGATQYAQAASVNATDVDGHASGSLTNLVISDNGLIQGVYDNGERIDLAQIVLADFASEDGLNRAGDGLWAQTPTSGQPLLDVAGAGGRGAISSGALEASNVELGNELVTLIAYQRAFQANAKTITTADEMMAEVSNIKR
jgi:flagellar hook protein FlgE